MTTRLSQRRVKGGDPAYPTLQDELKARGPGSGGGYNFPVGGIPRSDMTLDVQTALSNAERAYIFPDTGIPVEDLDADVVLSLSKADSAYQKPTIGIAIDDLEKSIQDRLNDFSAYYKYPSTGIPYVDLDSNVQSLLNSTFAKYEKPMGGIPLDDLTNELKALIALIETAYQSHVDGIPMDDLSREILDRFGTIETNIDSTAKKLISDHTLLTNTGEYTHEEIDFMIDDQYERVMSVAKEVIDARDGYNSLHRRILSSLFKENTYIIEGDLWNEGIFDNLQLSEEKFLNFDFTTTPFHVDFFDHRVLRRYGDDNKIYEMDVDKLDFNWPKEFFTIDGEALAKDIGIRVKGRFYAPYSGTYGFAVYGTGKHELKVSSMTLNTIDVYTQVDNYRGYISSIQLVGGQFYDFVLTGTNEQALNSALRVSRRMPGEKLFQFLESSMFNIEGFGGSNVGAYITKVIDTEKLFVKEWMIHADIDQVSLQDCVEMFYRKSLDDVTYSDWIPYQVNEDVKEGVQRYLQFKVVITRTPLNSSPIIRSLKLSYISSNNNYAKELEGARGSYLDLKSHLLDLKTRIQEVSELASAIDHSDVHTNWLGNIRFGHVDINMLRLHWYQLQATKTAAHILPTGFVDDYHTDGLLDKDYAMYRIQDSKAYINPLIFAWDTTSDWMEWDLVDMSVQNGSIRLSYYYETDSSIVRDHKYSQLNTYSQENLTYNGYSPYRFQPFYLESEDHKITQVRFYSGYRNNSGYTGYMEVYLMPALASGMPDMSKVRTISTTTYNNPTWATININIPVEADQRKWFFATRTYSNSNWVFVPYYQTTNLNLVDPFLRGDNPENKPLYMLDQNYNPIVNRFAVFEVTAERGFKVLGEAQVIKDFGREANFVGIDLDITNPTEPVHLEYATSMDGFVFSKYHYDIGTVPNGRYLKIHLVAGRGNTNLSPTINRIGIRHYFEDIILQTMPIDVGRIPTHIVLDVDHSDHNDLRYEVSRNGGQDFIPITLGVQHDVRSSPPGKDIVVRVHSERDVQDDNVWIDYMGMQAIVQEDYSPSNIVSMHQEEKATEGQQVFVTHKPYFMGDNSLQVYVNGSLQNAGGSYEETNEQTITFKYGLLAGDIVIFRVAAGAYRFTFEESGDIAGNDLQQLNNRTQVLELFSSRTTTKLTEHEEQDRLQGIQLTKIEGEQLTQDAAIAYQSGILDDHTLLLSNHDEKLLEHKNALVSQGETIVAQDAILTRHETHLADVGTILSTHDGKITTLEGSVVGLHASITSIGLDISALQGKDVATDISIESIRESITAIEKDLREVHELMAITREEFDQVIITSAEHGIAIATMTSTLEAVQSLVTTLTATVGDIGDRIERIETNQLNLAVGQLSLKDVDEDSVVTGIQISKSIALPSSDVNGAVITWSSLNTDLITSTGVVSQPTHTVGKKTATLEATITYQGKAKTKQFILEILAAAPIDNEKVDKDTSQLDISSVDEDLGKAGIQVTNSITLPTAGETYQSPITWVSSNTAYLSDNGIVTRPTYKEASAIVTLTATIKSGVATRQKAFEITVLKVEATDSQRVMDDKALLSLDQFDEDALTEGITRNTNMTLPKTGQTFASAITWVSSDITTITNGGVISRPVFETGDKTVTLTATIKNGSATDNKVFTIKVEKLPISDASKVAIDINGIDLTSFDEDPDTVGIQVTTNQLLPDTGLTYSSPITWTSSHEDVFSRMGVVVRPTFEIGDTEVTLTATITLGQATDDRTFTVVVLAEPEVI